MESPTRRSVLRLLAVGAGLVVAPGFAGSASGLAAVAAPMLLRRSVFAPYVGTPFLLRGGGRTYRAILTTISDIDTREGDETGFSMLFETPRGHHPPEGIYEVSHALLQSAYLYLGPVGAEPGTYEAIVNA